MASLHPKTYTNTYSINWGTTDKDNYTVTEDLGVLRVTDENVEPSLVVTKNDGEAEDYVNRIQNSCLNYEDQYLSPSIACGLAYKENVEETIEDKISDAEYLMFEEKIRIKNSPEYKARLYGNK